jgi:outer membrane autotransporter protein
LFTVGFGTETARAQTTTAWNNGLTVASGTAFIDNATGGVIVNTAATLDIRDSGTITAFIAVGAGASAAIDIAPGRLAVFTATGFNRPAIIAEMNSGLAMSGGAHFADNKINTYHSGALAVRGGALVTFADMARFTGNTYMKDGGAIDLSGTLIFRGGAVLASNTAGVTPAGDRTPASTGITRNAGGGAITASNGDTSKTLLHIGTSPAAPTLFENNYAYGGGGAIYQTGGRLVLDAGANDIIFRDNTYEKYGNSLTGVMVGRNSILMRETDLTLNAAAGHTIWFHDQIMQDATGGTVKTITKNGDGRVYFTGSGMTGIEKLAISLGFLGPAGGRSRTLVNAGLFELADGIYYGSNQPGVDFTLATSATLRTSGNGTINLRGDAIHFQNGSLVEITGNTTLTLTSGSARFEDGARLAGHGALAVNSTTSSIAIGAAAADTVTGSVAAGGTLAIGARLSGAGALAKHGGGLLILSASNARTGATRVAAGELRLAHTGALGGGGGLAIDAGATASAILNNPAGGWTLSNTLTGGGLLAVDLGSPTSTFNLNPAAAAAFTGTARLSRNTFTLAHNVLARATLVSATGNRTTVAAGVNPLAGLVLDGGRIDFDTRAPAATLPPLPPATIAATGTIRLVTGTVAVRIPRDDAAHFTAQTPLLQQDDGAFVQLASSAATTGNIGGIALVDLDTGALVTATQTASIHQSGVHVADGAYGYGLAGSDAAGNSGLYVSYDLRRVDILAGRTLLLDGDTAATAGGAEFHAIISGSGHLALDAASRITLNAVNRHTGSTTILGGTVIAGADDTLGRTAWLTLAATAALDLNGNTQTIGGGRLDGALLGSGSLGLNGRVDITGTNTNFVAAAGVTGTTVLHNPRALGGGGVHVLAGATLVLDTADGGAFATALDGTGRFVKDGAGTVVIARDNTFVGDVHIRAGTLVADAHPAALGTADVAINAGAAFEYRRVHGASQNTFTGDGALTITDSDLTLARDNGMALAHIDGSLVTMAADRALGDTRALVTMHGPAATIRIDTPAASLGTLRMNGGLLAFAAPAGFGDASATYKRAAISTLDAAAGAFLFNVDFTAASGPLNPANGMKADHLTITNDTAGATPHLVRINPAGTPATDPASFELIATGNGLASFALDAPGGKLDLGANAYTLVRGDGSDLTPGPGHWYLASAGVSDPVDVALASFSTISLDWNIALDALHQRMGDVRMENLRDLSHPASTSTSTPTSRFATAATAGNLWMRTRAYRLNAAGPGPGAGPGFRQHGWGLTAGLDKNFANADRAHLLGAFLDAGTVSHDLGHRGDSRTDSLGAGVYLTRLRRDGWFSDLVARADGYRARIDARANGRDPVRARYDTYALGFSAEAGRRLRHRDGWWIEPALQASGQFVKGVDYDTTPETARIRVSTDDAFAMQYRALVRVGRRLGKSKWQPHGRFGVVAVDTTGGALRADRMTVTPGFDGGRVEFGAGATCHISENNQLYFDYEYARALRYERPWSLNIGYRQLW